MMKKVHNMMIVYNMALYLSPSRCSSDTCCDFPPLLVACPAKPDHDDNEDSFDDDLDDYDNDGSESDNK